MLSLASCSSQQGNGYDQSAADQKIDSLLSVMSVKEKVGQMTQLNIDVVSVGEIYQLKEPHSLDQQKLKKAIVEYGVGSILNAGSHAYSLEHWREIIAEIQEMATSETEHKIPVLYGIDAIHGAGYLRNGTLFPQPLAQAATFNPSLVKNGAAITAYETRASGIPWNFSPVLDVARQPLWSRVFETYGEDVYLCTQMGLAAIEGYQENGGPEKVGACLKHFLGYSMPFTGRDRTTVKVSERELREYFLPPFKAAIDAGAMSIMVNSGDLNGRPVHADPTILTALLREELGFEGLVVTDWEDIMKLEHPHRVAVDLKQAVKIAVDAGIDMAMVPNDYRFSDLLLELVNEGEISEKRLDESVRRILKMKFDLGLFDQAFTPEDKHYPKVASEEFLMASHETAAESITLLKNKDNVLPLPSDARVVVTGPASNSLNYVNGAWSRTWQGVDTQWNDESKLTIVEALIEQNSNTLLIPDNSNQVPECDYLIVCLGETPSTEKPGDINSLDFDEEQINLVKRLALTNKKIILVLVENRMRIVREVEPLCDGIVMAYQPSENGTQALAQILYGSINPSGKLPVTYPKYNSSLLPYDHRYTDKLHVDFSENAFQPQWEFGYGLSYSNFQYKNLKINPSDDGDNIAFTVSVDVENASEVDGKEAVLLFVSDQVASIAPPVKRLRNFDKRMIKAGETEHFTFSVDREDLSFIGIENQWVYEPGEFVVNIGNLSDTITLK